jgi:U32 family peptidase
MPQIPDLIAPAGTPEKLKVALHFGADGVYCGLKQYSMRSFAGNFSFDKLEWAITYAHERSRKVYVTVNILAAEEDLAGLAKTLEKLQQLRPDGIVVGDAGVVALARQHAPDVPLHLSTQLSVTQHAAANFWFEQGIDRIVVARELSIEQLSKLVASSSGAIECFVHGAVCIAYSGRCLLSLYWAGRDPRKGACAQGCRWQYRELEDGRRPGEANRVEEDERGTYFFDAKDLCALPLLDQLVATGIKALKIEGRTRSEHYAGVVTDVYRNALDSLGRSDNEEFHARQGVWLAELQRPVQRGFSTHFLAGQEPGPEAYNPEGSPLSGRNDYLGKVVAATDDHIDVIVRFPFAPGDAVELRDSGLRIIPITIPPLTTTDGEPLDLARPNVVVRLRGRYDVSPQAMLRVRG